jgi:hypothetical protein
LILQISSRRYDSSENTKVTTSQMAVTGDLMIPRMFMGAVASPDDPLQTEFRYLKP